MEQCLDAKVEKEQKATTSNRHYTADVRLGIVSNKYRRRGRTTEKLHKPLDCCTD